jgi:hypothetical protein
MLFNNSRVRERASDCPLVGDIARPFASAILTLQSIVSFMEIT